ncbi:PREDICTED: acyl-CoA-binding protein-like [Rhagoletis zephyria]|uniref:acyl-CoA-binding protein-like n=1 Tax=Rhagoletis zephyria TaxID=28612 RepID=UPI000811698D|nr:PREDICTED: acyl-CoA-binding protein-like [Rhagoletis zephyria]XP_036337449.1 acyl-CoA-binding protein-like [Rhagoletis pomonella]XP_036337450.1 acyl-CoA-binding protein-like [Rhagoletis pomonella]
MDFHTASEKAKAFTKKPTDAEFLEFYGLYKQATVGDVNIPAPGALDLKAKAKFDAWSKHKGLSADDAKAAYIAVYQKYAPKYA